MAQTVVDQIRRLFVELSDLPRRFPSNLRTQYVLNPSGLLVLLLFGSLACSPSESTGSRELLELERLVFVPAGSKQLSDYRLENSKFAIERPMVVDRFEATLGDWRHYFSDYEESNSTSVIVEVEPETWPVGLNFTDAERLAKARGMRLLSAQEWIYIAIGPRGHPFPWGASSRSSVANTLELRLDRPVAVGTFENGVGPFGCYDLMGNAWEWVTGSALGFDSFGFEDGSAAAWASVMGGSWRSHMIPIYGTSESSEALRFNTMTLDSRTRSRDLGVRHGADAADYLWEQASQWGSGEDVRRRLLAVGERFGDESASLLEELSARPDASPNLAWLAEGARR